MGNLLFLALFNIGILAGRGATTDGYVYLGHNEDIAGEKMLNIYNVPRERGHLGGLWFEFPGQVGDSYVNEYGVSIVSNACPSKSERKSKGKRLYKIQTKAFRKARSAREAVRIIGSEVGRRGCDESGRSFLIADANEGWVCCVARGRIWVAQRVPEDHILLIGSCFNIGEVNLEDTLDFMGSKNLVRYAERKGWYDPGHDGAFNFTKAYADPSSLSDSVNIRHLAMARNFFFGESLDSSHDSSEVVFSGPPSRKFHRRDLSNLLSDTSLKSEYTALTTIFTMNPAYSPEKGTVIWVGYPSQDAASQSQWTIFTKAPDPCHRFTGPGLALRRHFKDAAHFRDRWPDHFYWHYLYPETNIDVAPRDFTVYVPRLTRAEAAGHPESVGDSFNDHFHVLEDPARGLLHAFWTQGSWEAADDEHVVYSQSQDGGRTWTDPVIIAGSATRSDPRPVAAWQQPMISRSGRLYCLWNQETTVKKHLCGLMYGRYSDDGGKTWSEPGIVPFTRRFLSDPEDPSVPPTWCMWQRPLRLGRNGEYLAGCSRYGRDGISRVEFWRYDNIDDDPEIGNIHISFFNTDEDAFDASKVGRDNDYMPREGLIVEEACIVGLPDGRLFSVMRTSVGSPIWSVSSDGGESWSRPEILRTEDGGEPILHPCSPCPIYDYAGPEARSGKYFLMVHNTFDFNGLTAYQNRGPLYKFDGRFVEGAHQPVWFENKGIFTPRDSGNSFYSSYTALNGEGTFWFGDQKYYLFGKRMN